MSPRPIVLHGNNLDSNRGCQALRLTTQAILDRYLPEHPRLHANIFVNDEPQFHGRLADPKSAGLIWETRRRGRPAFYTWGAGLVGSRLWRRYPRMKVHAAIDQAAAVLAVGGDNLSLDYGLLPVLLFFSPLEHAARRGVPTAIWAGSVGSFAAQPKWQRRFADLLRRIDILGVRESATRAYLDGLGIRDNVHDVVDPAFLLPAEPAELPPEMERLLESGAVGVNLSPLITRYGRLSRSEWRQSALRLLTLVCGQTPRPVILIPHVMMAPWYFPDNDDLAFMTELHRCLPAETRRRVWLYDARRDSSMQVKWVISRLHALFASRFHAAVAGLSSGVPTLCLGYGIKVRGAFSDIFGHDDWHLHIAEFDWESFERRIRRLLESAADVRGQLREIMPPYVERAWKSGELLRNLLSQSPSAMPATP